MTKGFFWGFQVPIVDDLVAFFGSSNMFGKNQEKESYVPGRVGDRV